MVFLKKIWKGLERIAFFIGNIITGIVMTVFYFTIFAIFAVPFRIFTDIFKIKYRGSTWIIKNKEFIGLENFKEES